MNLMNLGWNQFFASHFEPYQTGSYLPARVFCGQNGIYQLYSEIGEVTAELAGKLGYTAGSRGALPVVGDWVLMQPSASAGPAVIHAVLPRQTCFKRKAAIGSRRRVSDAAPEEQVIAANVNTAFLVSGLDREFNLRRIERYLTLTYTSGAMPVLVLNKADACATLDEHLQAVAAIAGGVPTYAISAATETGIEPLRAYLQPGQTVTLLGSSGVGKSTLINALLGHHRQRTQAISAQVQKGQHTTTHRELILLPQGGLIMDNPGMRELQLLSDEATVQETFEDIEAFAAQCRFSDCEHRTEPHCAVKRAIEAGTLEAQRLTSYLKQKKEVVHHHLREEHTAQYVEKSQWKQISQWQRKLKKK